MKSIKEELITNYSNNGFVLIHNLISSDEIKNMNSKLDSLDAKITLPDGKTPWGYGNLIDDKVFNLVLDKPELLELLNEIVEGEYTFNHLLVNNKSKWIGPPVEWHQEFSLVDTYAAGYTEKDITKFAQIYIAIDEHKVENGCLTVFPGSHKLGLLPHDDIIGYNLNHKKQLPVEILSKLNEDCPSTHVLMKPGDCLVFNHLLVHGSGSNNISTDRRAIILQARSMDREIDKTKFDLYSRFRLDFAIDYFREKIEKLSSINLYKDFIGYDKKNTQ